MTTNGTEGGRIVYLLPVSVYQLTWSIFKLKLVWCRLRQQLRILADA